MDTLTQVALGAAIAEAGFRERLGGKAVVLGACCGLIPDLDILSRLGGEWLFLIQHRSLSHSLFFLVLLTPFIGWIGYWWSQRRSSYWHWCHLCFWALITHPLLDICTSYGTQFWAPFSDKRLAIDAIAIIDPLYTLPLLLAIIIGNCRRFSLRGRRHFAMAMLIITTLYLGLGYWQGHRAVVLARQQLAVHQHNYREVRATPTLFNIWLWRVIARDNDGNLQLGMVSTIAPQPITFQELKRPDDPLVAKALQNNRAKIFRWFAMDMISIDIERHQGGTCVLLHDQRYGMIVEPAKTIFNASIEFDNNGRVLEVNLLKSSRSKIDIQDELQAMWHWICGKQCR